MSSELKQAYELKEMYRHWFTQAKEEENLQKIKEGLEAFYRQVEQANSLSFIKRVQTLKNG